MPFSRPSLAELIARIKEDFENRLETAGAALRVSFLAVLSRVIGGAVHLLHGHIQYISKQVFADTAEVEFLERLASVWGLSRIAATFAEGDVTATGTNGTLIPAGTIFARSDGAEFESTDNVTISGSSATVHVIASVAGSDGNTDAGVELTFQTPITNVDTVATVTVGTILGGADAESDDDLRARLLSRIQNPPAGGNAADYERWALEVAGVTRAWVEPSIEGEGTVGIFFVRDDESPITPDAAEVSAVSAYIVGVRPVTALPIVIAPTADPIDFTIELDPPTVDVMSAVEDELEDLILRDSSPGGTILWSRMQEAISIAAGESDHTLISPTGNFVSASGYIATMGTITWA